MKRDPLAETAQRPGTISLSHEAWPIVRLAFEGSVTPQLVREFLGQLQEMPRGI
jgi:hypothetical protein